jgi:hypothetical protein
MKPHEREQAAPKSRLGMAGPHQPRQPDDGHDQGDPSEEEQRVGDVELRGVVMSGVVVPRPFSVL